MSRYATPDPIDLPATAPGSNPALLIFLHGFDDDGEAYRGLSSYLQSQSALSHLHIILPTAPLDHDSLARAWFPLASFSPIPVGRSSSGSALASAGTDPTDLDAYLESVGRMRAVVLEASRSKGVPLNRVLLGGFSQGAAVSLGVGVGAGDKGNWGAGEQRLAGVVGLCGFLPHLPEVEQALLGDAKAHLASTFFVAQGGRDMLIPSWMRRETVERVQKLGSLAGEGRGAKVQAKIYDGIGHGISTSMAADLVSWLSTTLPA